MCTFFIQKQEDAVHILITMVQNEKCFSLDNLPNILPQIHLPLIVWPVEATFWFTTEWNKMTLNIEQWNKLFQPIQINTGEIS